jgi:hypothetical protein
MIKTNKIIFIDSNVFIKCAIEEIGGSGLEIFKKLELAMDEGSFKLILPENIEIEVRKDVDSQIKLFAESVKSKLKTAIGADNSVKGKKAFEEILNTCERESLKIVQDEGKKIKSSLDKILNNKNCIKVKITKEIISEGILRAVLKKAPGRCKRTSYLIHQDCIAFEAILNYLDKEKIKKAKIVICSEDSDYQNTDDNKKIDNEILAEFKSREIEAVGYNNPLDMLNGEIVKSGKKYTKKDIKTYKEEAQPKSLAEVTKLIFENSKSKGCTVAYNTDYWSNSKVNDSIRFCPYCGHALNFDGHKDILASAFSMPVYTHYYDQGEKIYCPYCGRSIDIN